MPSQTKNKNLFWSNKQLQQDPCRPLIRCADIHYETLI